MVSAITASYSSTIEEAAATAQEYLPTAERLEV
jgi:hypothetical protein